MRQLSSDMLQALFAGETGEAVLGLVTIEEESLSEPIRVTSDGVSTFSADQDSDTAEDKTSNGNDGTLVNGPTWTSEGPNDDLRGALSFDGVDDWVDVGETYSIGESDSFTAECWIRFHEPSVAPSNEAQWPGVFGHSIANNNDWLIWLDNGSEMGSGGDGDYSGTSRILFEISGDNTNRDQVDTGQKEADTWYHVAAVYDAANSKIRLFIDASLAEESDYTDSGGFGNAAIGFAADVARDRYAHCEIAEPRFWKGVARTQQQIQDNMNTRLNGDESGLVGYWPLNDTTKEFIPCPFRYSFPDQSDEGEVQAKLKIDNVDRRITKAVRNASGTPTVTTQLVLASTPDTIEAEFPDFELTNVGYDKLVVEGTLTVESMTSLPFPAHTFDPQKFPNLF